MSKTILQKCHYYCKISHLFKGIPPPPIENVKIILHTVQRLLQTLADIYSKKVARW